MSLARVEDHGDRLVVVNANAGRRGALSPDLYEAVIDACTRARGARVGAVLITSEGGFFCAGGDLNALRSRRDLSEAERRQRIEDLHEVIRAIRECPVPVIAAVEGGAAGAGLSMALACDFVIAGESARFTAAYIKAGLVPDGGLTAALARLVPRAFATEMCLLGQPVPAGRMQALGAIYRTVPDGQTEHEANALIDVICAGPPAAQTEIKKLIGAAYDTEEAIQMNNERNAMAKAIGGSEAAEGIAAFLEKRPTRFAR
ncbi:enoyl-CoA hydratase/isomerase family protein [Ruegeria pomeroyi]|uniref:Enoyl-CoA hydratase/isomerase family protein n=1 Tax=Ruegeria pomeroyi TaxID=89184 RepID=A0A9Q3ZPB5_9RHOB|nr:enoyl-CoA hydratase/isomerase family protein [Ruegeria pomeroyi]MCE8537917.1 enoyl-CoA hydratase/isomerase family protein [Ruegeria pomeroyi]